MTTTQHVIRFSTRAEVVVRVDALGLPSDLEPEEVEDYVVDVAHRRAEGYLSTLRIPAAGWGVAVDMSLLGIMRADSVESA